MGELGSDTTVAMGKTYWVSPATQDAAAMLRAVRNTHEVHTAVAAPMAVGRDGDLHHVGALYELRRLRYSST